MTIEWAHGTPRMWAEELTEAAAQGTRGVLAALDDLPLGDRNFPDKPLGLLSHAAASAIVILGPEPAREILAKSLPLVERAVDQSRRLFPANPWQSGIGFLSYLHALECCAVPLAAPMAGAPAKEWLEKLAREPRFVHPDERLGTALACLAFGVNKPVGALVGGRMSAAKLKAGRSFYDDLAGYARYLALGLQQGVSADAVHMAWRAFVWSFPTLDSKYLVGWNDLLWAAHIHYHLFEKRPVAQVGAALHAFVRAP